MALTALITRPDEDAEPLAAALIARGITVVREPLLSVKPVSDAAIDLDGVQALLFTSANGVRAFANLSAKRDLPAFAVGDNTARAARAAGFETVESAAGAIEDLARLVARRLDPKRGALFHAAGSAVAGDLAGLLGAEGFELRRAMLYSADQATALSDDTKGRLERGEIGLVLLFSPRTAETFLTLVREAGEAAQNGIEQATALCLSAAVAKAVQALPWRSVMTAEKPDLPAMLRLVDQAAEAARPAAAGTPPREPAPAGDTPAPADIEAALKRMARRPAPARRFILVAALLILIVAIAASRPVWQPLIDRMTRTAETVAPASDGSSVASNGSAASSAPSGNGQPASPSGDVAGFKAEVAQVESDLALIQAAMERAAQERQAQWERIGALEKKAGELAQKLDDLVKAQAELQSQLQQQHAAGASAPALPDDIAALPAELADLRTKLDSLAAAQASAATASQATPDQGAAQPAPDNAALAALQSSLDQVASENARLKESLDQANQRLGAIDQLQQENSQLKATLNQAAQRLAALEARPTGGPEAKDAALLLATARLKNAIAAGRPFTTELQAVDGLAANDDGLSDALTKAHATLGHYAPSGLPTTAMLLQQVPDLVDQALTASGGALAETPTGQDWLDRLMKGLSKLVRIRPSGGAAEGDSVSDRLSRAETAAASGDLPATAAAMDGLTGPAADVVKTWREQATARLEAEPALDGLEQAALARLTASPSTASGGG